MTAPKEDIKYLRELLFRIPKTEIHLHIEGLASVDTIWNLIEKHNIAFEGIKTKDDLQEKFKVKSLNEFIDLFINVIQNCFQEESDFSYLIDDTKKYLERNNIIYTELFFAPSKFVLNGFSFKKMVEVLDEGAKKIAREDKRGVKFIIDVSRSFGPKNAMQNLELTLKNPKDSIIGIGLGGAENQGPAKDYTEVFKIARDNGLKVVAHAGEDVGSESIWQAILDLGVQRIGHGISAIKDDKLMEYLKEKQIPLEVCPTSNLFTRKYATSYENHPIKAFFRRGINVTLNTDDPAIFGAELIDEYINMIDHKVFTLRECIKLIKNNIYATFLSEKSKDILWEKAEKVIKTYCPEDCW